MTAAVDDLLTQRCPLCRQTAKPYECLLRGKRLWRWHCAQCDWHSTFAFVLRPLTLEDRVRRHFRDAQVPLDTGIPAPPKSRPLFM
jgi:hypothetical protein